MHFIFNKLLADLHNFKNYIIVENFEKGAKAYGKKKRTKRKVNHNFRFSVLEPISLQRLKEILSSVVLARLAGCYITFSVPLSF